MANKVEKIVTRLQERIQSGQYYEAQQQTRVVALRYIKSANWPAAVEILFSVSQSLLRADQGASAGDLCVLLVDVYKQAALAPDSASKGKLLTCLRLFQPDEPTRKKFITDMVAWSAKFGEYPAGDPELHHVIGSLYADEHEPYEAERHLVIGTRDSIEILARLEYAWYKESDESHAAPHYAARAIFPYLLLGNVRAANAAYKCFVDMLVAENPALGVQETSTGTQPASIMIFNSLPLLNYLGLLLIALQRGAPDLYRQLVVKYSTQLAEVPTWAEPQEILAEMYFGITKPRQSNPLMDMMGSLFGGGGFGGSGGGSSGGRGAAHQANTPKRIDTIVPDGLD